MTKTQFRTVMILNIIIAVLLTAIFLLPLFPTSAAVGGNDNNDNNDNNNGNDDDVNGEVHEKYRASYDAGIDGVVWENKFESSGRERLIDCFVVEGKLYVFLSATVGDKDFDRYGGYVAVIGADGKIENSNFVDVKPIAACLANNGFLMAANDKIYFVNYALEVNVASDTGVGEIEDVCVANDGYAAVYSRTNTVNNKQAFILQKLNYDFSVNKTYEAYAIADTQYIDLYEFPDRFLATVTTNDGDNLGFCDFAAGRVIAVEQVGAPQFVLPYENGYFGVSGTNAFTVGYDLNFKSLTALNQSVEYAACDFAAGRFYRYVYHSNAHASVTMIKADLSYESKLSVMSDCKRFYGAQTHNGGALLIGASDSEILICDDMTKRYSLPYSNATVVHSSLPYLFFERESDLYVIRLK